MTQKLINQIIFQFEEGSGARKPFAKAETLGVYFDTAVMEAFLKEKEGQLAELKKRAAAGTKEVSPFEHLLPFEQELAHEAYHIYQFLTCTLISDYAAAMRRRGRLEAGILSELAQQGSVLGKGDKILNESKFPDQDVKNYIMRVRNDADRVITKIDKKQNANDLSIREIVEACAVSFQLISQNDYLGVKLPFNNKTYTIAWDRFLERSNIQKGNETENLIGRLIFLYIGDIYLKYAHNDFQDTRDFEEMYDLVIPLINQFHKYVSEFEGEANERDELFLSSLSHVESDPSLIDAIVGYCGSLPEEDQMKLYVNVRLYTEIYKRVTIAGAPQRYRPNNNKNRAVNMHLKELFPFWPSDFSIPCVLSSFEQCAKFSSIWMNINDVTFMDEVEKHQLSLREDNQLLDFMAKFSILLHNPNLGVNCCSEHGHDINIWKIAKCTKPNSVNQLCIRLIGKPLEKILDLRTS